MAGEGGLGFRGVVPVVIHPTIFVFASESCNSQLEQLCNLCTAASRARVPWQKGAPIAMP